MSTQPSPVNPSTKKGEALGAFSTLMPPPGMTRSILIPTAY